MNQKTYFEKGIEKIIRTEAWAKPTREFFLKRANSININIQDYSLRKLAEQTKEINLKLAEIFK